ncbi:MAG TPA: 4-alpha-glucanotransferase [Verrucomicrobiae bacterium]|nr:4-alpha-glucanotransferase [Verrucomicrobiae bacterium]
MKNLGAMCDAKGICHHYEDSSGRKHVVPRHIIKLIGTSMEQKALPKTCSPSCSIKVLKVGETLKLSQPSELLLEDGSRLEVSGWLPRTLPSGYHSLNCSNGRRMSLLVTPGKCYLPKSEKAWGWAIQLYAMRSQKSWGMGDLGDLRDFNRWSAKTLQSNFVLINPLAAVLPISKQQSSPYYPSSRRFLNPLYLRIEDVPVRVSRGFAIEKLARDGRALNSERLIDRDKVFLLKMTALGRMWKVFGTSPGFEAYCRAEGCPLKEFATFCALAEHFKSGWALWPTRYHDAGSTSVKRFAEQHSDRVLFHQWLQWLTQEQLRKAAHEQPIIQDLPVGVDPGGADAWSWRHMLAPNMSIGAPPDAFNVEGQDWGMQPFIPQLLRESVYLPLRQTLQAMLRFGGGLRIDHVMGLFRLFWIPQNLAPGSGTYVRYPAEELLAVIAIESQRARTLVVGEDLGTVETGVRTILRRQNILSYRLMWFEQAKLRHYPKNALAAVSTHDLFTLAGLWKGSDLERQRKLGLHPNEPGMKKMLNKLRRRLFLKSSSTPEEAIRRTYHLLSKAPSRMIAASLDDALASEERPNLPGTTIASNWSMSLPKPLETIKKTPLVKEIAHACQRKTF